MLILLTVPGDVLDGWLDETNADAQIGTITCKEDGTVHIRGVDGEQFESCSIEATDRSYSIVDSTRKDPNSLGVVTGVATQKLKRVYADMAGSPTMVQSRMQRLNSDRARKLNKRRSSMPTSNITPSSSLSTTNCTTIASDSTPGVTPASSPLKSKTPRKPHVCNLSRQQQDIVIEEVMAMVMKEKLSTFTFKMLRNVKSLEDISQRDLQSPLEEMADMKRGTWTVKQSYKSMYGI